VIKEPLHNFAIRLHNSHIRQMTAAVTDYFPEEIKGIPVCRDQSV